MTITNYDEAVAWLQNERDQWLRQDGASFCAEDYAQILAVLQREREDAERLNAILLDIVRIHRSPSGNFTARSDKGTAVHGTVERESDADYLRGCKAAIDAARKGESDDVR